MTIRQLETFLAIAEKKNFTSAAENLGYAQSTVTTQIKQLEDELGCLLFERLGRTIVLTPEGERLMKYALKMTELEREIMLEVPESKEPTGILRIGISESFCYTAFPKLLSEYRNRFPKIEIQLKFIDHVSFPALLKSGDLDLVYTLNPSINLDGLLTLYKVPQTLGFYANPDDKLATKRNITEIDLENIPLLLSESSCSFRTMLITALAKKNIIPNIALETSSKEILKEFAIQKLGIAFLPDITAEKELKLGLLKRLDWQGSKFEIFSQIIIHKDKHLNIAMEKFIEMIKENNCARNS